ncbi:MAG: flagellar filament capping protein FliD [Lachnospiraceae bacterium]
MAAIQSAYTNLLQTYGRQINSRYDVHRNSELRNVCHSIIKLNTDAPVYKLRDQNSARSFAVAIKAHAHEIQNVIASFSDAEDGIQQTFQRKVAVSSQPEIADVSYIGDAQPEASDFFLEIRQLATPQVNTGKFLLPDRRNFPPGDYSFGLETTSNFYEFQFFIEQSDKNPDVINNLSSLINQAKIGVTANVLTDEKERVALQISSDAVGCPSDQKPRFIIQPTNSPASEHVVVTLGIDQMNDPATNAVYSVDGTIYTSQSNTCNVGSDFELILHQTTNEQSPVHIGFKPDSDAIFDHISILTDCYNQMLQTVSENLPPGRSNSALLQSMRGIAQKRQKVFHSFGLSVESNGEIRSDKTMLIQTIEQGNLKELYQTLTDFAKELSKKANTVSLDPVRYLDNIIILYKNPGHNLAPTYLTSLYAGLFYDQIC